MPTLTARDRFPYDHRTTSSPPRFARSGQMTDCLRREWLYSEKRPRDLLFAAIEDVLKRRSGLMVSQLAREAASLARQRASAAGLTVDNWDATTRAVMKSLLVAGVLTRDDGSPIAFDVAAQATTVGGLAPDFVDRAEAHLLACVIARLGDVTTSDHRALAHALFRQFDARVPVGEIEDRVVVLLARLSDRISLVGDTYQIRQTDSL